MTRGLRRRPASGSSNWEARLGAGRFLRCCFMVSRESKTFLLELAMAWHNKANELVVESNRIRKTIKEPTDAEERCKVRSEVLNACADELSMLVSML